MPFHAKVVNYRPHVNIIDVNMLFSAIRSARASVTV
jgi:hypothetical protein